MPKIVEQSISILSDAGLGMAMFSLGGFTASLPIHLDLHSSSASSSSSRLISSSAVISIQGCSWHYSRRS